MYIFSIGIKLIVSSKYCLIVAHILPVLPDCVLDTTIIFIIFLFLKAVTTLDAIISWFSKITNLPVNFKISNSLRTFCFLNFIIPCSNKS